MGPDAMFLVFWMLSFKPIFSLSSFSFIKRLCTVFLQYLGVKATYNPVWRIILPYFLLNSQHFRVSWKWTLKPMKNTYLLVMGSLFHQLAGIWPLYIPNDTNNYATSDKYVTLTSSTISRNPLNIQVCVSPQNKEKLVFKS